MWYRSLNLIFGKVLTRQVAMGDWSQISLGNSRVRGSQQRSSTRCNK